MKKGMKFFLLVFGFLIIVVGLLIVNAFNGNPVSKMMAKKQAKNHIAEHYGDRDFIIDDVFYNFKDGYYNANVISPSSIDSHFTIYLSGGKAARDSYDGDVLSGWNTYERIDREYRELVDDVFLGEDFPLVSDIDFGTIEMFDENIQPSPDEVQYGIKISELELDKQYDVKQLAETAGHIIYYAQDDEISFEKAAEFMLILKNKLDEAEIPFYAIDFVLEKPRNEDGVVADGESIHIANFLYEDIDGEGLVDRIEAAHETLMKYYEEEDAKMKDE